ncbi:MAG: hypothetical protein H7306_21405 [Bacteriovorax sp.]|nr:hypothetical protein [Rhizobacter sp.]
MQREVLKAVLLTPGFVGVPIRLGLFLAAGGKRHVDAVAHHFYAEDDREFIRLCRWLRGTTALGCRTLPAQVVKCEGERGGRHPSIACRPAGARQSAS